MKLVTRKQFSTVLSQSLIARTKEIHLRYGLDKYFFNSSNKESQHSQSLVGIYHQRFDDDGKLLTEFWEAKA